MRRTTWLNEDIDRERIPYDCGGEVKVAVVESQANLVSSLIEGGEGLHLPVLDVDFSAQLVPSTTSGHFHLYLDGMKPMTWRRYRLFLWMLAYFGVIEWGYYKASVQRGMTMVRKPGVKKKVAIVAPYPGEKPQPGQRRRKARRSR